MQGWHISILPEENLYLIQFKPNQGILCEENIVGWLNSYVPPNFGFSFTENGKEHDPFSQGAIKSPDQQHKKLMSSGL